MLEFPWFSKHFGPGKYESFELDGHKTYVNKPNNKALEIILIPTISISTMNNWNYSIKFSFLCWNFSFTYWKLKWMKIYKN